LTLFPSIVLILDALSTCFTPAPSEPSSSLSKKGFEWAIPPRFGDAGVFFRQWPGVGLGGRKWGYIRPGQMIGDRSGSLRRLGGPNKEMRRISKTGRQNVAEILRGNERSD
jgi:hypothetical protein